MQPLNQIIKEIGIPVWICWGFSAAAIVMAIICKVSGKSREESWLSVLPLPGILVLSLTTGMIFYFANDSIKSRKKWDQERAMHNGELAAIRGSPVLEETKPVTLDRRLQSLEGIIGYLDQNIKMEQEPKNLTPIMLFLAKELKTIRDEK